ncbi:unnamed protein product [Ilex paraguariensis]|uniref:Dirigent protein n=1 Tax=Ilex paraguariensis TaxID=185542 RepID=A0ABC8RUB8_9AQUA
MAVSGHPPLFTVMVAHANLTMNHHFQSLLPFGSIYVVVALLTEGPDRTANVVGHAQGFYVSAGKELLMVLNCIDYGFTDGEFSGSSTSMFSRNPET